jgi:phosphate-selective porin OprO/OprP
MRLKLNMLACTALTAAALVSPALAKKAETVTMTREQYEAIMGRLEKLEKQTTAAPAGSNGALEQRVQDLEISQGSKINALQTRADAVQLAFDNGRPVITTGDGRFEMAFRGRFHFDAGTFNQSPGNDVPFVVDGQNLRDQPSGSFFRRAQFGVEGKFFRDFDYEMRFNFGGTETEDNSALVNIMRVAYNPTPEIRLNIGAIQPTFTLDDSTSSNDITFLERSSVVNALISEFGGSDGRKGVEATYLKQSPDGVDYMINVAYTTSTTGGTSGTRQSVADDRDHLLGRVAARVYKDTDWDVHLGANAATILSMGGVDRTGPAGLFAARNLNFRDRPELRLSADRFIATGNIAAESAWMWGLEAGLRYQNFYIASEYFNWGVERDRACQGCNLVAPDPDFSGYYVMASWILTGETKRYETQSRSNSRMQFGAPRPNSPFSTGGTYGAFELAARWSVTDLDFNVGAEGVAPIANNGEIRGGKQQIASVALNWYLNRNMRVMFQYQHVDIDRLSSVPLSAATNPLAPSSAYPNIGQEYDTFAIRTQFAF